MAKVRYFNSNPDFPEWSSLLVEDYTSVSDKIVFWIENGPSHDRPGRSVILDKEQLKHLLETFAADVSKPVATRKWTVLA